MTEQHLTPQQRQDRRIKRWTNQIQETMFSAQMFAYQIQILELNSLTAEVPALKQEVRFLKQNINLVVANFRNIKNFLKTASPQAASEIDEELSSEKLKDISLLLSLVKRFDDIEGITNDLKNSINGKA